MQPLTSRPVYNSELLLKVLRHIEQQGHAPTKWDGTKDNIFYIQVKDSEGEEYIGIYKIEDDKVVLIEKK